MRLDQKVARGLLVLLLLVVFAALANEFSVAADARRLTADVSTRELDRLDDLWAAHDRLAQRSSLHWGTIALERALTQRTLTLAERIIANYRMALPTVREAQWQSARNALEDALRAPLSGPELQFSKPLPVAVAGAAR